jgi:hypothetical protein
MKLMMKKFFIKKSILILVIYGLSGCSLFGIVPDSFQNRAAANKSVEVKDIPFDARPESEEVTLRRRVVLLPFLDASNERAQSVREGARSEFVTLLQKTKALVLLEPSELEEDIFKKIENNEYKLSEMTKHAEERGISALIEGKILDIHIRRKADSVGVIRNIKSDIEAIVRIRIFDTKSGREILNKIQTLNVKDAAVRWISRSETDKNYEEDPAQIQLLVNDAFGALVPFVVSSLQKVSWEGRVALIQGDRVYINVGRLSGIQVGDLLKVSDEGQEVFDPESGSSIGKVPGRMKGTLEVVSYFGQDAAVALIHSGSGIKENDKVELY